VVVRDPATAGAGKHHAGSGRSTRMGTAPARADHPAHRGDDFRRRRVISRGPRTADGWRWLVDTMILFYDEELRRLRAHPDDWTASWASSTPGVARARDCADAGGRCPGRRAERAPTAVDRAAAGVSGRANVAGARQSWNRKPSSSGSQDKRCV
jgi:hypothetical protein